MGSEMCIRDRTNGWRCGYIALHNQKEPMGVCFNGSSAGSFASVVGVKEKETLKYVL